MKIIGSWINQQGYTIVRLSNKKCIALHKLIYQNKTGHRIPKNMEVHHKDGNIQRNCISNLKLVPKEINVRGYR